MNQLRLLERIHKVISAWLVGSLLLQVASVLLVQMVLLIPFHAQAAEVVIDSTASTGATSNNVTGAQNVFLDDQTGYTFYRDSTGQCAYQKTTDAGATWSGAIVVDSQTDCVKIVVWYDRWTPGDTTGNLIHIATLDTSDDDIFYNYLDTTTDTLFLGTTPVNTGSNSGQVPTISVAANTHTITKATDGKIYVSTNDVSDAYIVSCTTSCGSTTSWNEVGTSPLDLQNDHNILMPLSGGNVLIINRDISANDFRSSIWNGSSWSSWNVFDANAVESATFDGGMSATIDIVTGFIYLAYAADNDNNTADHDIRTAIFDGSGWTNTTDVFTDIAGRGLNDVSVGYDQNTGDVYVVYAIRDTIATPASANVYYRVSTDAMTTWGAEQGPLTAAADNYYKPVITLNNYERMYVTWWGSGADDLVGETVADIGPDTLLATQGAHLTEVRSPTTDFYIGGQFVVSSKSSRSISSFRLTETGTIDGDTELNNIKLYYELDTSVPYDCASESYGGGESQFGATDTNGFSGANGSSVFAGTIVNISPTETACFYPVLDVLSSADAGDTIKLEVSDPVVDVVVSGTTIFPDAPVSIAGSTTVLSPNLTQNHYHWRNDNGSETGATSATGGVEDTALTALSKESPVRLRIEVSNEGATTSLSNTFRLEYGTAAPTCNDVVFWTDVGLTDDAWNMSPSGNITDGADTTNIAEATGGVTDEASTFLTPNGALRDLQSTTSPVVLEVNEFIEIEYSIVAAAGAVEGETYCFRVTDEGEELSFYTAYPQATIDADVRVSSQGAQIATADIPGIDVYFGGTFVIKENVSSRSVTDITVTEIGTLDAQTGLDNVRLFYDTDTSVPYDCVSESYSGGEPQFGSTDTDGFSAENGTSTFSDTVSISTTSSLCIYVVADVTSSAVNNQTVQFEIQSGSADVLVSSGSVAPATPVTLTGSTTLSGGELVQTHYHWRNDDGTESGASSATGGVEDTALTDFNLSSEIRLRFGVTNNGSTSSVPTRFLLEFGPLITTCENVSVWTSVDATAVDDWDMSDSANLTNGSDTTNILEAVGGVTDENTTFLTPNGGVRDTEAITASTTIDSDEHTDIEYSITSTVNTLNGTTYCFRLSANGAPLQGYTNYAQVSTVVKRDFRIQRGNAVVTGTSTVLVAGTDYIVPNSSTSAFIRITNSHHTGAGDVVGGGTQNVDDVTAYIENPENIETSITIARPSTAIAETFVDWEIIEFVGQAGTDNEMIVRDSGVVNFTNAQLIATGSVATVVDDSKVVVFITGSRNQNTSRNFYAGQVTSDWNTTTNQPVFTRGATGASFVDVSYAVVEFTGLNWNTQRVEHTYDTSASASTTAITPVSSLEQAFLHTQKRMGASTNVVHFGHTVWLSSVGAVSFELEPGASIAIEQTSVAWVIENTQTGSNGMNVQRQSGSTINGAEPLTLEIAIPVTVNATNNTSLFVTSRAGGTNNGYPRPIMGARITSVDTYELWRSDTGTLLSYQAEVVEWPVADLALRQNYYRFYVDNDALTPTDPWPPALNDLGENTSLTVNDEPLGEDAYIRLRMSIRVANANMPAGLESFKLQFAERVSTCTAVASWSDVGQVASSTIWRGYIGTSTTDGTALSSDPPLPGDLLISVSDVAGTLEHTNNSSANPYVVFDGEDVEYDWYLQQKGATPETTYCFRVVRAEDDSALDGYLHYPQIRTAGFSPVTANWRWYSDIGNETPSNALSAENVAPANINIDDTLALRVTVKERANVNGFDTKFRLEFSDDITFFNPVPLIASSSCLQDSLWCYIDGGGVDNALITESTLSDSDGCVASAGNGCGRHNASSAYVTGHTHGAQQAQEYSFTLVHAAARVNAVYYFRLIDAATDIPVPFDTGGSYPSVVSGESSLTFSVSGLPAGTSTAGVVTDATTTATDVNFGELIFNDDAIAAQRITVETNATEGYQVLKYATQNLLNSYGVEIASVSSTNAAPAGWVASCAAAASTGCVGYHTTDAVLSGGSTRFAPVDTYAELSTEPVEIMFTSLPVSDTVDVVYRVLVDEMQPAGDYVTDIVYLAVPVF